MEKNVFHQSVVNGFTNLYFKFEPPPSTHWRNTTLASITPNYGNISMSGNTDFETNEVSFSGSLCEEDGGI